MYIVNAYISFTSMQDIKISKLDISRKKKNEYDVHQIGEGEKNTEVIMLIVKISAFSFRLAKRQ